IERLRVAINSGEDIKDISSESSEADQVLLQISPHIMQVIDEDGRITDKMPDSTDESIPVDIEKLRKLKIGTNNFESVKVLSPGVDLRVVTRRSKAHLESEGTYYIRLGQPLVALKEERRRLLVVLGVAIPLVLLLGSTGGLLLANQALRPVDRIT